MMTQGTTIFNGKESIMPDIDYVKDYKEKELRQYVVAYLLIVVAFVGLHTVAELRQALSGAASKMPLILQMIMTDIFLGAVCVLVIIFNEIWPDRIKTKLIYWRMPSDDIFTRIANGKIGPTEFDLTEAKAIYAHLATAPPEKQTSEWSVMLRKCRKAGHSNVLDAQRMQLMTRDICITTLSLLIMSFTAVIFLSFIQNEKSASLKMLGLPVTYLTAMLRVTGVAARNRANRLVALVIKNDIQEKIADRSVDDRTDAWITDI